MAGGPRPPGEASSEDEAQPDGGGIAPGETPEAHGRRPRRSARRTTGRPRRGTGPAAARSRRRRGPARPPHRATESAGRRRGRRVTACPSGCLRRWQPGGRPRPGATPPRTPRREARRGLFVASLVRAGEAGPPGARHRDEGVGQDHGAVERAPSRQERCPVVVHREEPARVAGIAESGRRFPERGALVTQHDGFGRGPGDGPQPRPPVAGLQGQAFLVDQLPPSCRQRAANAVRIARPKPSPPARSPGRRSPPSQACAASTSARAAREGLSWNSVRLAAGKRSVGRPAWSTSASRAAAIGYTVSVGVGEAVTMAATPAVSSRLTSVSAALRSSGWTSSAWKTIETVRGRSRGSIGSGGGPLRRFGVAGPAPASSVPGAARPGCGGVLVPRVVRRRPGGCPTSRPGRPGAVLGDGVELGQREIDALLDLGAEPCPWTGQREQGPEAEDRPGRSGGRPRRRALRLAGRTRDERRDGRDREMPASHAQPNLTVGSGGVGSGTDRFGPLGVV